MIIIIIIIIIYNQIMKNVEAKQSRVKSTMSMRWWTKDVSMIFYIW